MTDKLKKAALFICTLIVLTVSLLWVAWGIRENSRYHRITAKITEISEFNTENSNFYKNKSDNEKYTAAYVTYKYKASNSTYRSDDFIIYEFEKDKYAVGDDYYIYKVDGWNNTITEHMAQRDMSDNLAMPLIVAFLSFIAAVKNIKGLKYFGLAAEKLQFCFILSIVIYVICAGYTAYTLFFWQSTAIFFSGLDELVHMAATILVCAVGVIADAVAWKVSINRLPDKGEN